MRITESIRKNAIEVRSGSIVNKFKIMRRRETFFFDDMGLEYIKILEENGYGENLREISKEWGAMIYDNIFPSTVKKLPYQISFNLIVNKTFRLMGYMDSIKCERSGGILTVKTKNENNVKTIGINNLHTGFYMGLLSIIFKSDIGFISARHFGGGNCEYLFRILNRTQFLKTKKKETYDSLNSLPKTKGYTLKDALRLKILINKGNNIYFRGRRITPIENTIFHIFGHKRILMNEVPKISYKYFRDIIRKDSSNDEKLKLLKNLLQIMGWGIVKIISKNNNIKFFIDYPPHGIQKTRDNWDFLVNMILGYLWLINEKFRIKSIKTEFRRVIVNYHA